ncbi:MAG: (Fe-S)-binding protein [Candidatus Bipolaricaulia bacterium]
MIYLYAVLGMGGIAAFLAALLAISTSFLSVEQEFKVKITNNGAVLTMNWGDNLMNTLKKPYGYTLMASCGGSGTCATCRVKAIEGVDEPTPAQLGPMSAKLRNQDYILSCQTSVRNDLVIELFEPLVTTWPDEVVEEEEEVEEFSSPFAQSIREVLPGFNCYACGYPTCAEYAEAVAAGNASHELCLPGGEPVLARLQEVLDAEAAEAGATEAEATG